MEDKKYFYVADNDGVIWGSGETIEESEIDAKSNYKICLDEPIDEKDLCDQMEKFMTTMICSKSDYDIIDNNEQVFECDLYDQTEAA